MRWTRAALPTSSLSSRQPGGGSGDPNILSGGRNSEDLISVSTGLCSTHHISSVLGGPGVCLLKLFDGTK